LLSLSSVSLAQTSTITGAPSSSATTAPSSSSAPVIQGAPVPNVSSPVITNQSPGTAPVAEGVSGPAPIAGAASPELGGPAAEAAKPAAIHGGPRNEFQDFIARSIGYDLPLYGYNLFEAPSTFAPLDRVPVPADYVIGPGDEIAIRAWGQIDVDYRAVVDRDGRLYIPKVGNINVVGAKFENLDGLIRSAVSRIYKNFELTVTMGQLRSIQIFVVGQARRPGSYTVSSLSTLVNALFATGGPSSKGSMRRIQLKRGDRLVTEFDVYDLLIRGNKSKDAKLLPGDVVFIPPVGQLVAIAGSVNAPAIYELRDKQTLDDLVSMAGGLTTTAFGQKVLLERIRDRETRTVDEFALDKAGLARPLRDGDLVRVLALSPRFDNAVTLQGNVALPARYPWRDGMRISDLLHDNNDLLTNAFYERQNRGRMTGKAREREVNWDFAVIQRLDKASLTTRLLPFNLGTAILGNHQENLLLQPGDIVTVYAAGEPLPKTDADIVLQGSLLGMPARRFAWREGMKFTDIVPNAQWLVDYYDYWNNLKGAGLRTEINWEFANVVRLNPTDLTKTTIPFDLGKAVLEKDDSQNLRLQPGDEISIFTRDELAVPVEKQAKYIHIEGEVPNAGVYRALPGETLRQLLMRVGGVTGNAYVYGAEFTRESTRVQQQKRLDESLDRLEAEAARLAAQQSQSVLTKEEAESLGQQVAAQKALVAKLRQIKATGRIVLEMPRDNASIKNMPDLALEDGDRLYVPPKPSTVSVFGAVYNQNAFIYRDRKDVGDYLDQAGGPTKDADRDSLYLVKADGTVVSKRQGGWWGSFTGKKVMPGDAIVVPEELIKFSWTKELKDWSQIFYQFALGVVSVKVLKDL
jgi:protein involved in polysaccharide export with SLBB domain